MENGWIKLHRKFLKWEWIDDPNMVAIFLHLLLLANHEPGNWHGVKVDRGQLITGRNKLAKITGISIQSTRRCLERLKSTNEITIKSTNQFSIITIVKWDEYQGNDKKSTIKTTSNLTSKRPASDQQTTTNKNEKNEKNEKKNTAYRLFFEKYQCRFSDGKLFIINDGQWNDWSGDYVERFVLTDNNGKVIALGKAAKELYMQSYEHR